MQIGTYLFAAAAVFALGIGTAESQVPVQPGLTYADLADLSVTTPVAAHVRLSRASALKGAEAAQVPAGITRFFIEAEVISLIRGAQGLPSRISYLADVPSDAKGKAPKLGKKSEFLILAQTVPGRPGEVRLVAPDAQLPYTAERADTIRRIMREATATDVPPRITGIGKAFHVPGSLAGESETQIFLQTADARPLSLNILRRPGQTPQWAVALSEIVDDAAAAPRPDTLLWYRLACTLPRALPAQSYADAERAHVSAIQADYRFVLERLGPCARSRRR